MSDVPTSAIGRRAWDKGKTVSAFVLVIGALFQGGFLLVVREMLQKDERQQNAERITLKERHDDTMLLFETLSDQLDTSIAILQARIGEEKPRPKTLKIRRIERKDKLKLDNPILKLDNPIKSEDLPLNQAP
jgi:hypothetical protein